MSSSQHDIREHIGIAIDGGGVRGAIVAHGLIELEEKLGTRPLINDPRVKVVAGTSTGSLIASALAIGLTGEQILGLYTTLANKAFSSSGSVRPFGMRIPLLSRAHLSMKLVRWMDRWSLTELLLYLLLPARYSFDPLRRIARDIVSTYLPALGNDPTLGDLGALLSVRPNRPTLIITAVDVTARQTRFLKSTPGGDFAQMPLIDALLASCSIPTYFDPVAYRAPGAASTRWLVDGGVGNFGNPALVVAWELADERNPERHYDPATVTLYSFGTGYVPQEIYEKTYGQPVDWWALEWAMRIPEVFVEDTIREQTRNIVAQYPGLDLRRFQVALDRVITADRWDLINNYLYEKGQELRALIRDDQHALQLPPPARHDPERILNTMTANLLRSHPTP